MKKDVTTFTRYLFLLIIVFVVWVVLLHKLSKDPNLTTFFGRSEETLFISSFIEDK